MRIFCTGIVLYQVVGKRENLTMLRKIHPAGRNVSVNSVVYADISTSRIEFT